MEKINIALVGYGSQVGLGSMLFGSPRILFQRILKIGKRFLFISLENSIVPA